MAWNLTGTQVDTGQAPDAGTALGMFTEGVADRDDHNVCQARGISFSSAGSKQADTYAIRSQDILGSISSGVPTQLPPFGDASHTRHEKEAVEMDCDPTGTEDQVSGMNATLELSANGVDEQHSHIRGISEGSVGGLYQAGTDFYSEKVRLCSARVCRKSAKKSTSTYQLRTQFLPEKILQGEMVTALTPEHAVLTVRDHRRCYQDWLRATKSSSSGKETYNFASSLKRSFKIFPGKVEPQAIRKDGSKQYFMPEGFRNLLNNEMDVLEAELKNLPLLEQQHSRLSELFFAMERDLEKAKEKVERTRLGQLSLGPQQLVNVDGDGRHQSVGGEHQITSLSGSSTYEDTSNQQESTSGRDHHLIFPFQAHQVLQQILLLLKEGTRSPFLLKLGESVLTQHLARWSSKS
eukprot:m.230950 g.230950  ORF g.230950 m.230950 type:complete len:407 (+) comp40063_c0_seq22:2200-3420(+)